jgi:hypothetical protein
MPRRKLFQARVNLPMTIEQMARIEAVLQADEYVTDFIRAGVKRELERREKALKPKPRKAPQKIL